MAKTKLKWPAAAYEGAGRGLSLVDAYRCGELIETCFADQSIRKLPAREGLALSHVTLVRARAAYRVLRALGIAPETSPLSFAHLRQIDHLPPAEQRALARRVVKEDLSAKQLERLVRGRKGVSTIAGFQLALRALAPFDDGRLDLTADLQRAGELSEAEARRLAARAKRLAEVLRRLERAL
ncbi:MAG: hypothetical protein KIT72_18755 [Polyangiaceae bacterium]|nr:hypothetical protein [Polyangiaceae bacterium]MCW5792460.1 hypothetical protein [Polyangiaceae bacterium]